MGGSDVAQHAAGADRGELLVVTDQPDAATALEDELHRSVQGEGVGHPGLVDHHERGGVDAGHPVRHASLPVCSREWVSLASVSVWVSVWEPIDESQGVRGGR